MPQALWYWRVGPIDRDIIQLIDDLGHGFKRIILFRRIGKSVPAVRLHRISFPPARISW